MAENTEQNAVPQIPEPVPTPRGKFVAKYKGWLIFGALVFILAVITANSFHSPADVGASVKAAQADQARQRSLNQNPSADQVRAQMDNMRAGVKSLQAEADRLKADAGQRLAAQRGGQAGTADPLSSTQPSGQDPRFGPTSQQATEAEQQRAQLRAEREALAYKSLFADNLIHQDRAGQEPTRTPAASANGPDNQTLAESQAPSGASEAQERGDITPTGETVKPSLVSVKPVADKRKPLDFNPTAQPTFWLPEGTVIEGVLTNKLEGEGTGPVNVMISSAVYLPGTKLLLIPQGARVLGEASKVSSFGQGRLAVAFHRVLVPGLSNYSIPLDKTPGLAQAGEVGLKGKVNSHYASIFGASLAVGAIGGLAQIGNTGTYSSMGSFRNGVSESTAQSADRILEKFLNRLPSISVTEGTRCRILLTDDLQLPSYGSMHVNAAGGGL